MSTILRQPLLRIAVCAAFIAAPSVQAEYAPRINVYRDANCGCCKAWIAHLEANGFQVIDHVEANMDAVKQRLGVPPRLSSCHTGVIDGKFVEGHVPAAQVLDLGKRADLRGIAVPGMPHGSPGMEIEGAGQTYQVIGLNLAGTEQIVANYPAK